jgi:hypothetical protein
MRSRLAASAKKVNTRSRGSGKSMEVLRTLSVTLLIVICRLAPLIFEARPYGLDPDAGRFPLLQLVSLLALQLLLFATLACFDDPSARSP